MIEVKNLTKRFGKITAVDNLSFTVNDGEILGFLGPNGAGKSTTMNMMTGFISSTEGTVLINGYDILKEPLKAKGEMGYLPEMPPVYGDMTVSEYLDFVCDIKKVKKSEKPAMAADIMETVKITAVKDRVIKNLSKGYRQRVGLAQALVGYPNLLILDEPTVGLDPKQVLDMRDVIKSIGKKHTIILSSHILQEVSAVCDRVIIINKGKMVTEGSARELSDKIAGNRVKAELKGGESEINICLEGIESIKSFTLSKKTDSTFEAVCEGAEGVDIREDIFKALAAQGIVILEMKAVDLSLEDIFIKVISGSYEEEEVNREKEMQEKSGENHGFEDLTAESLSLNEEPEEGDEEV